jgi:hypothetical protein
MVPSLPMALIGMFMNRIICLTVLNSVSLSIDPRQIKSDICLTPSHGTSDSAHVSAESYPVLPLLIGNTSRLPASPDIFALS